MKVPYYLPWSRRGHLLSAQLRFRSVRQLRNLTHVRFDFGLEWVVNRIQIRLSGQFVQSCEICSLESSSKGRCRKQRALSLSCSLSLYLSRSPSEGLSVEFAYGFGFQVSGFGFRVSSFGFRFMRLGFGVGVQGFRFRIWGFK